MLKLLDDKNVYMPSQCSVGQHLNVKVLPCEIVQMLQWELKCYTKKKRNCNYSYLGSTTHDTICIYSFHIIYCILKYSIIWKPITWDNWNLIIIFKGWRDRCWLSYGLAFPIFICFFTKAVLAYKYISSCVDYVVKGYDLHSHYLFSLEFVFKE